MEREVTNGHVSGKNISPFIIGNFSGEILESYSLYMKGTILNSATRVKMNGLCLKWAVDSEHYHGDSTTKLGHI